MSDSDPVYAKWIDVKPGDAIRLPPIDLEKLIGLRAVHFVDPAGRPIDREVHVQVTIDDYPDTFRSDERGVLALPYALPCSDMVAFCQGYMPFFAPGSFDLDPVVLQPAGPYRVPLSIASLGLGRPPGGERWCGNLKLLFRPQHWPGKKIWRDDIWKWQTGVVPFESDLTAVAEVPYPGIYELSLLIPIPQDEFEIPRPITVDGSDESPRAQIIEVGADGKVRVLHQEQAAMLRKWLEKKR